MAKTIFGDNEEAKRGKGTTSFKPSDYVLPASKKHALYDKTERHSTRIVELAQSIVRYGLIEPIVVNPEGDQPVVAEGRRRIYAGLMIEKWIATNDQRAGGLAEIRFECVVKKGNDAELMGIMIAANEHRLDNVLRTRVMQAIRLENAGAPLSDIVIAFGKDPQTIKKWLKLGNMSDRVQEAVFTDVIALDAAMLIHAQKLDREGQDAALDRALAGIPASVAEGTDAEDGASDGATEATTDASTADAPATNGNGKKRRTTANDVRRTLDPNAIIKPSPKQLKNLLAVLEHDATLSRSKRHFSDWTDGELALATEMTKLVYGKLAAKRIKGMVKALDGRVAVAEG